MRSNQLRMLLAALGYVLIERLRALALQGTALASAQIDTLRIKLLKVAAVITRNTRRIRLYLASHWPSAQTFAHAMPTAFSLGFIQRMARAMTQKWPATQAGVGVSSADRLNTRRGHRNDIQAAHRTTKPASTQPFNPHGGHCGKYPG